MTREIYSLFAPVRPGNSGGPLLNPQGDVLGVVFAASLDDKHDGVRADGGRGGARRRRRRHCHGQGVHRRLHHRLSDRLTLIPYCVAT